MCGIVGFIDSEKKENTLSSMLKTIHYRGPDDRGTYFDNIEKRYLHFGHVRLSILDISSQGHQPFVSACGKFIIIYNGEVYNFNDIREELLSLRYEFKSHTDTEVILYAFKEWGIKAVDKFIGMFAFAIYDKERKKIFIIRDRAGVKPLYYYRGDDLFLFASELKAFHEHPKFKREIHREILSYYFQFGYIPAPYSIYKNCYKLKPGHYLELDIRTNDYKEISYWDSTNFYLMEKFDDNEDKILQELENLLINACSLRMVSDVPVGVFLSGGYDSTLVTALLQTNSKEKINTFTIGFDTEEYNEATHAKKIADYLGTNHTEYYCTNNEMLQLIEKLPFYFDEPFADSSAIPTMLVSAMARKNVTVALSADGGDEAFFGYSKYFALNKIENSHRFKKYIFKRLINLLNESQIEKFNALLPSNIKQTNIIEKFKKLKRALNANDFREMFIQSSSHVDPLLLDEILNSGAFKNFNKTFFKTFSRVSNLPFGDQMMAVDYKTFMVDDVLTKVDRSTMSVSLEGREPLLDHRIIEYMARVPFELKYKNNQGKYMLRQIIYKYIPKDLVDKPKSGFTVPLKKWLETDLRKLALDCLDHDLLLDDNIFKKEALHNLQKEIEENRIQNISLIWTIMMYVMWREKWM